MSFEDERRRSRVLIIGFIVIGAAAMVALVASSYSPSDEKLSEAVDLCTNNEESEVCQQFLKRYDITFAYCHKFGDQMDFKKYMLNGQVFDMPIGYPVYGVAWFGDSSTPPDQTIGYGENAITLSSYYGCDVKNKI